MPFPNPNTQFKPGESGNPKGLAKGTKHINTWIQELLEDETFEMQIQEGYEVKDYKGAPIKAILHAQLRLALNSRDEQTRIKATELLMKYGWSKRQEIDAKVQTLTPIMGGITKSNDVHSDNDD